MATLPESPRPGDSYVQSFARGLEVIRSFTAQAPRQTLSEVAAASGLTRAGARRILLTLQTLDYVESDGKLFSLTPKILDLGFAYLSSMPIWDLAEPVMQALVDQVHESSSAAVLEGDDILYVLRVHTQKIMSIRPGRGLAPAGLLHVDGPRAAGGLGRRSTRGTPENDGPHAAHQAHRDRPCTVAQAHRSDAQPGLEPGRPGAGRRPDLHRRPGVQPHGPDRGRAQPQRSGQPHQRHGDAADACCRRCWRRRAASRGWWRGRGASLFQARPQPALSSAQSSSCTSTR